MGQWQKNTKLHISQAKNAQPTAANTGAVSYEQTQQKWQRQMPWHDGTVLLNDSSQE